MAVRPRCRCWRRSRRLRDWLRVPEQEAAEEGFGLNYDAPAWETADDDALPAVTKARALRNERPRRKRSALR